METTTYGYNKPESGDRGTPLFDALGENIQLTNDHTHDGTNSAKISVANLTKLTQAIEHSNWANPVEGLYSQNITIPNALFFDNLIMTFTDAVGERINFKVKKLTDNSFTVYCNDAAVDATILYT